MMIENDDYIPKHSNPLGVKDVEMIAAAVKKRRGNFPDEPMEMTIALILLNIGARFRPVSCVELEWKGLKRDIPKGEGVPKCPNGHVLFEEPGLILGWMKESE